MQWFSALIPAHPDIQAKAQDELDRVVGRERLPDFDDKDSLPYITALCKEVLRWHPPAPLALPHGAITEDEYKGMRIPDGSILFWKSGPGRSVTGAPKSD